MLWLLGWLALTVLLVRTLRRVELGTALDYLAAADLRWVAVAVLAAAAILPTATAQWLLLLPRGVRVSFRRMFGILSLTASLSNGPPFPAGLVATVHLLAGRAGLGAAGAASLLALEQFCEGLAKLALVAVALAVVPGFSAPDIGVALGAGLPAIALALLALARRPAAMARLAVPTHGWRGLARAFLHRLLQHMDAVQRPGVFALAIGLGLAKKGLEAAGIAATAAALGHALPFRVVVGVLCSVNLASLVAPTPAALGIWEGAAYLVLRSAGLDTEIALAVALLAHLTYLLPLVSVGWAVESARLGRGLLQRYLSGRR